MTQNQVSLEKKATRMEKAATSNAAVLNRNTKEFDREKSEKKRDATPFIFLPPWIYVLSKKFVYFLKGKR